MKNQEEKKEIAFSFIYNDYVNNKAFGVDVLGEFYQSILASEVSNVIGEEVSIDFVNHFIQYFESNEELQSIIADMSVEDVLSNMLK